MGPSGGRRGEERVSESTGRSEALHNSPVGRQRDRPRVTYNFVDTWGDANWWSTLKSNTCLG